MRENKIEDIIDGLVKKEKINLGHEIWRMAKRRWGYSLTKGITTMFNE